MSIYFEAVVSRFIENLKEFEVMSSEDQGENEAAILTDGSLKAKIVYSPDVRRFFLFKGDADCADDDFVQMQSYFFEPTGDKDADLREAGSVANEFTDTFGGTSAAVPIVPDSSRKASRKDRENDETSAVYFANRIPSVLPECREPLLQHKEYFEMLLPNKFCDEVVNAAVAKLLSDKSQKKKTEEFFAFLDKMYVSGDLDVKSIITMTILNNITGEERMAYVEGLLSDDLKKSWRAARRFIGKEVKPEKETTYQQLSKHYRSQLMDNNSR